MGAKINHMFHWLREAWLVLGVTFALLLLVELVLSVAFVCKDAFWEDAPAVDRRAFADTYKHAPWPKQYYEEFMDANHAHWVPYVYWRHNPYEGQFISIDSHGVRKTWHPGFEQPDRPVGPTVFFLGGSTLWGIGARDDFTIPSLTAKGLAKKGIHAQVVNFAESGYVSTQEVVLLLRELQKGHMPDVVVFFDGANDTYSAYQHHIAGIPLNEFNRAREFNSCKLLPKKSCWQAFADKLAITRFVRLLARASGFSKTKKASVTPGNSPHQPLANREGLEIPDIGVLTRDVVDIYIKNMQIVHALAEHYDFTALFYWQPIIFEKSHLTAYEVKEQHRRAYMAPFFNRTYHAVRQSLTANSEPAFHDLSVLFSDVSEPLFVDWCHLGERGNAFVAEKIAADILLILGNQGPGKSRAAVGSRSTAPMGRPQETDHEDTAD